MDNALLSARYNAKDIAESLLIAFWIESKSTKAYHIGYAIDQLEKLIAEVEKIKLAMESESL